MNSIHWADLKQRIREDIVVLPHFLRNPVQGMRALPHWEWPTLLILQGAFAAACAVLGNLLERDWLGVVVGLVLAPLLNILITGIAAGFFYYLFIFAFRRDVPYRQIYLQVAFASIPMVILNMVAFLLPPLVLLGSATTLILLYVGFIAGFHIPAKPIRNLFIGIFLLQALYWCFQQVQTSTHHKSLRQRATPETLDILERELKND